MKGIRIKSRSRRSALLAGLLLYLFGLLPFLASSHHHEADQGHGTCQLCEISSQACDTDTPALIVAFASSFILLPSQDTRPACQSLHLQRESRGPPSA